MSCCVKPGVKFQVIGVRRSPEVRPVTRHLTVILSTGTGKGRGRLGGKEPDFARPRRRLRRRPTFLDAKAPRAYQDRVEGLTDQLETGLFPFISLNRLRYDSQTGPFTTTPGPLHLPPPSVRRCRLRRRTGTLQEEGHFQDSILSIRTPLCPKIPTGGVEVQGLTGRRTKVPYNLYV